MVYHENDEIVLLVIPAQGLVREVRVSPTDWDAFTKAPLLSDVMDRIGPLDKGDQVRILHNGGRARTSSSKVRHINVGGAM